MSKKKKNKVKKVWQPFQRGELPEINREFVADMIRKNFGIPEDKIDEFVEKSIEDIKSDVIYMNNFYQVNIRTKSASAVWPEMLHLSIKRIDKQPVHDWRHFQRIKDEVLGPEYEAVELYPSQERMVDTANQYHLWAWKDPKFKFPFGFFNRAISNNSSHNTQQRKLDGVPDGNNFLDGDEKATMIKIDSVWIEHLAVRLNEIKKLMEAQNVDEE